MATYLFSAVNAAGQRSEGTMEGASKRGIVRQLLKNSLHPTHVEEAVTADSGSGKIGPAAISAMYGRLGELLDAGVPLAQALKLVAEITPNKNLQVVMRVVYQDVNDGIELPVVAARYPEVFSPVAIAVLRASLEGDFTAAAMKQLETSLRKSIEMRSRLIGAMTYPAFLCGSGLLMLLALFLFFIPRFEPMFAALKEKDQLPLITTIMMATSEFTQSHLTLLMALLASVITGVFVMIVRPACRLVVLRSLISVPRLGEFIVAASLARFSQLMSTLLKNGVNLDRALQLCSNATGNLLCDAATRVSQGESLSSRFRSIAWIPREFSELLVVGERTNRLSETLGNVSEIYERRVSSILSSALKLVEPVLLVCIGLTVAAMVFALVLPILRASSLV
ncbi:MAG: type II secretion system F family protein [Fuerstiella sp.]|nr:type II secretion system F family protein [Fuerstiella sp.]